MIAFRKSHPSISRSTFWRDEIKWYGTDHLVDFSPFSRCVAYCLHGESEGDDDLYVMINGDRETKHFGIYEGRIRQWKLAINTAASSLDDEGTSIGDQAKESRYKVCGNSIVVLVKSSDERT